MSGDAQAGHKRSAVIAKHSLAIAGHRTSISLEQAFWDRLCRAASLRGVSIAALVAEIDANRGAANLSSAIRVFVLEDCAAEKDARPGSCLDNQAEYKGS